MKVRISLVPNKFAGGGEIPPYRTGDPSVLKRDLNNRVILPSFNDLFSNHRPEDIYEEEGYIPLEQGKGHQYTYNDIYTDYIGRLNEYNQSLPVKDSANILTNEKRTSQGLNRIGDTGAMPVVNDMFKGVNTLLGYGMQAPVELAKTALMPGSYIPYVGATNHMGELMSGAVDNTAGALFAPIMPSNYIDWGSAGRDGIHLKLPWQSNSNGVETPAFMLTMDFVAAPYIAKGAGKIAKWGKQYVNPFYESRNQPINLINERINRILQTSSEPATLMPERMEASIVEPTRTSLLEPERTSETYRTTLESPIRRTSSVGRDVQEPSQSIIEIPEPVEVLTSAELARLLRQLERQQNTHMAQETPIQGFDWSAFDEYERSFLRPTTEEIVLPINRQRGYNDRSILNESLNAEDFKLELANDYGIPIKEIDHFLQEKGLDLNDLKVRRRLSWSASEDLENFAKSYKKDLYSRHPELAETLIEFISDKTGLNKNFIGELLRKLNPEYFLRNISEISNLNNFIDNYYYFTDSAPMKMYSPKDYLSSDIYNELKKAMSDEEINNAFDKLLNKHSFIDYRDLQKIAAYPLQLKVSYSPIEGLNDIVALQEFSKNFGKHAHDNIERGEHNVFSKIRSGVRRAMNPEAELSINEPLDFNFSANSVNLILAMAKALSKERKALKRFPGMIQRNGDFRLRGNSYGNVNLGTKEEPKIGDIYGTIPTIEEMRTYPSRAEALLPINKNLAQTYKYFVENTQGEGMPLYHMDLKMLLDVIDAGGDVSKVPGAADATFTIGDDPAPIYMFGKFPETFNAPSYPNIRFVFNNGGSLSSNLFPDGGTLDDSDIPINNTLNTVNVYPTKIPGFQKWWNKTFRSKEGYYDWADRYADRHPQDTNTIIVNPEEHTIINQRDLIADNAKVLSESGMLSPLWDRNLTVGANEERIIQGQKNVRENALRSQALQVAENAERGLFPVYDDESNIAQYLPYNLALDSNDKPLSGTDPMAEFYVMNKALNPLLKLIGRGGQQVMARLGNQQARNQIMGRAFNNAADASFGFNNRFVTTPTLTMPTQQLTFKPTAKYLKSMVPSEFDDILNHTDPLFKRMTTENIEYKMEPTIRTKLGDIEINNPELGYRQGSAYMGEDFLKNNIVRTDGHYKNPLFAEGKLWYGIPTQEMLTEQPKRIFTTKSGLRFNFSKRNEAAPKTDLLVTTTDNLKLANHNSIPMKEIFTKDGVTRVGGDYNPRRIPKTEDILNQNNTDLFRYDPSYGYRKVESPISLADPFNANTLVDADGNVTKSAKELLLKLYHRYPFIKMSDITNKGFKKRTNLAQHISDVVKSALEYPLPEGVTRLDFVTSALYHDLGKIINGQASHGNTSNYIINQLRLPATKDVIQAIGSHMNPQEYFESATPLERALHTADVGRGRPYNELVENFPYLDYRKTLPITFNE